MLSLNQATGASSPASYPMTSPSNTGFAWWRLLNRYQWFVLIVASLGWLLDCMDQQLFNLARVPAMKELLKASLGTAPTPSQVAEFGGYATSIFLLGWASGGLIFGVLGDRWGRAKTMLVTILLYSGCTGLSALSTHFADFAIYRFFTGLGVGGEFAVGVALVAEVMPDAARPYALSLLQALSTVGNVTAALTSISLGQLEQNGVLGQAHGWAAWRWMFVVGALPAILVVFIRRNLKEPERWLETRKNPELRKKMGDYGELFGNPNWRKPAAIAGSILVIGILIAFLGPNDWNKRAIVTSLSLLALAGGIWTVYGGGGDTRYRRRAVVGLLLALSGVIGVWGIGFFSFDLVRSVLEKKFRADGMDPKLIPGMLTRWAGITSMMQNLGSFCGIYAFGVVAQKFGRRPAFGIALVAAMVATATVFWTLNDFGQIFWLIPIMGFFQLALFGGYAIYLPELFPTRLRSTGTSFCYNVGRFIAASGPAALGQLSGVVFKDQPEPLRYAGVTMCAVFLVGLCALPFAPETRGQPLPEEERGFAH
jgi:MFS family permease